MATLKTLTRFSQAPTVPETIPADAIVAIEIDNKIYKMTWGELEAARGLDKLDAAPAELPEDALFLVEAGGTQYKLAFEDLVDLVAAGLPSGG